MIVPIKKGLPIITEGALAKIRTLEYDKLLKLYDHTNDPVQKVLIEEIFVLKGYEFPKVDIDPPQVA